MLRNSAVNLVLKIGLAIPSLAFALLSFVFATDVINLYPQFVLSIFGDLATLIIGAIAALALGLWIISGKHKFAASATFVLVLFIGILANISSLVFVSIAYPLLMMAAALSVRYYPRIRIIIPDKNGEEKMKIVRATVPESQLAAIEEAETITVETPDHKEVTFTHVEETPAHNKHAHHKEKKLYGTETPFSEQEPHNDQSNKYSTLDSLKPMFNIPAMTDTLDADMDSESGIQTNSTDSAVSWNINATIDTPVMDSRHTPETSDTYEPAPKAKTARRARITSPKSKAHVPAAEPTVDAYAFDAIDIPVDISDGIPVAPTVVAKKPRIRAKSVHAHKAEPKPLETFDTLGDNTPSNDVILESMSAHVEPKEQLKPARKPRNKVLAKLEEQEKSKAAPTKKAPRIRKTSYAESYPEDEMPLE